MEPLPTIEHVSFVRFVYVDLGKETSEDFVGITVVFIQRKALDNLLMSSKFKYKFSYVYEKMFEAESLIVYKKEINVKSS